MSRATTGKNRFSWNRGTRSPIEPAANVATDRELLRQFLSGNEAAFAELVQRHSGLVMAVCHRVLKHAADAEDAFQATFLVLARKAGALNWNESIAGWLHDTARRTSLKLRGSTLRRKTREQDGSESLCVSEPSRTVSDPSSQATIQELADILDDELSKLPTKFRDAILLSQIEGLSRDELAHRLGIASVKDRLERGRKQLRSQLTKRGVSLTAVALAAWLSPSAAQAAGSAVMISTTAQAAGAFATGKLAAGSVPAAVTLAQGVLKMMGLEKLKIAALCVVSLLTAGTIAFGILRDDPTRFDKGLRGQIVSMNQSNGSKPSTVTVSLDDYGTLLNLDISQEAKVWTAFEAGQITDLKAGQFVSLRLAEDHRTVNEFHVQGEMREASIKGVASSGKILISEEHDEDETNSILTEIELAPDAILRIGGLPATLHDLKPGMQVPLEFSPDGKVVNAIEAEAAGHSLRNGELIEVGDNGTTLTIACEEDDDGRSVHQSLVVSLDAMILLDGKPSKVTDLKPGCALILRLSEDLTSIRAIKATNPEPADDDDE
jgi:RNA polymerase sigma factor (sigma-70 family)